MSSGLVVLIDPEIEIGLKLSDGVVDLFAESDAIELVEQGLVEPLDNTIRLRAFRFGPRVIDVFHGEVELVFVPVVCAAVLSAAVGQDALQGNAVLLIERDHPVVEQIGRGDRGLAVVQLGEADLGVGIDEVC